ncbi:LamG-like jellyroll fold domain-containing protein, partial [Planctomycetota bacterium]
MDDFHLHSYSPCIDQGDPYQDIPEPAPNRMMAHWKLDEQSGRNVSDSSGNDHTGLLYGDQNWQVAGGPFDGALYLDGDGDFIFANYICDDIADKSYTITAWINSDSTAGKQSIMAFNDRWGDIKFILGHPAGSAKLHLYINRTWRNTSIPVFDGNWHFIACVLKYDDIYHRVSMYIYVDGNKVYEYATFSMGVIIEPDDFFSIGQAYDNFQTRDFFRGTIDDVRVYQTPLELFAIDLLYTSGTELPPHEEDLDGRPRVVSQRIDMGAYEHQTQRFMLTVEIIGDGFVTPADGTYDAGRIVELLAIPDNDFRIKAWHGTDNDASTNPINTVTMDANKTVTIEFEQIPIYSLSTIVIGQGTVDPNAGAFYEGHTVALTAVPSVSWQLKSWTGTDDDSSKDPNNTVTMDAAKIVTVEFNRIKYPLTVHVMGGNGQITPTGGVYEYGTIVNLTATPIRYHKVKSWTGADDDASQDPNNTVTINGPKSVTVEFQPIPVSLAYSLMGGHGSITTVAPVYDMGSVVPLGVKANPGYRVRAWRGADDEASTDPNNSVTMLSDKVVLVELAKKLNRIKANVKAGKIVGQDTIKLSGNFYPPLDKIVSAENIKIKIGSFDLYHTVYTESLDFDPHDIKKGRYAYKHKIPKGVPGAITSFNFNLNKNTFALEARKINLSGLQSPLFLDIEFGDHDYVVLAELDEETINGPRRLIPMRLMRSFADSLRVDKAIVRINKGIDNDSLTVRGALAAKDPSVNLEQKIVTIKWADQTFLIPAHEFKKNK